MTLLDLITRSNLIILLTGVLMIVGVLGARFSSKMGMPSLVFYIGVGLILGEFFYYDNAFVTQLFGIFALIVILFEGGLQTHWEVVRPVMRPALSLATLGVAATAGVIGVCAKWLLDVSWLEGLLFGAIVGSTDAAAVFAAMGDKNVRQRLSATLEAESGMNDPMAVFLTVLLIGCIQSPDISWSEMLLKLFWEMALGGLTGIVFGKMAVWGVNRVQLKSSGLYPILALAFAVVAYSATSLLHGSGLLAVYLMAIILGNSDIVYRQAIFRFNEGFAWMMQIFLFILLGWLAFPEKLMAVAWQGLALSALLILVARPLGVWLSTPGREWQRNERMFIAWAGLRGAVPIVLAIYPLMAHIEKSQLIFNAVFFVVVTSALIQGSTISYLGEKLGAMAAGRKKMPHMLELVSLGKTEAEILEIEIEKGTAPDGRCIAALGLPPQVLIAAIVREQTVVTPKGGTVLQSGDIIYTLVPKKQKDYVHRLLTSSEVQPQYVPQPQ
ncbi:potassium/proton antiporter [Acetonema longum]|uniref:Potassium/proton antiporter n=1 Tax=Acetonema longum DSM 6540 TaxID=1009370 RepID=F7NJE2_9FIRM|nr:potassium/proton antiporter [Acetonema longum]EGO63890.1 potassium/proton antiporter [Acetonema longum DSM 6540]